MKKMLLSAAAGIGLLFIPATAFAASAEAPFVIAQDIDVRVGPGGVRLRGEGDRDRERGMERRRFRERSDERGERYGEGRRSVVRGDRCRTTVIRQETDDGVRVKRIRRCG